MNNLYFFLIMFIALLPFRKLGWLLSRSFLYTVPIVIAMLLNLIWAGIVSWLLWFVINYFHPSIILQIISYGEGAYLANANYGLVDENTIPVNEISRHYLLEGTAYLFFVIVIILFSLL